MGITLTDVLLFGKAQSSDVDSAAFAIMRRNILRWGAIGGYVSIVVHGVSPLVLPDAIANSLSYVKAFGGTEQRNLPAEYTQLEYIESTGTQHIDTGIKQQDGDEFGLVYQQVTLDTSYRSLFGASVGGAAGSLYISQTSSDTWVGNVRVTSLRPDTNKHTLSWTVSSSSDQSIVIDEINYSAAVQIIPNADLSVKVFARNETQSKMIGKVYGYYQKRNGEYLINLVPAKDSNNVIGMYDTVSGNFFTNQGTGDFVGGPEAVPTPDDPMDIVSNNGVLKFSPNLFDKNDINLQYTNRSLAFSQDGYWYIAIGSTSLACRCLPNTQYTISGIDLLTTIFRVATIDVDTLPDQQDTTQIPCSYIYRTTQSEVYTFVTPSTAKWIIVQVSATVFDSTLNTIQIEKGSTATPYIPYGQIYTDGTQETINVHGKNLFDKSDIITGKILNDTGAEVAQSAGYYSGHISVDASTEYTISQTGGEEVYLRVLEYDSTDTMVKLNKGTPTGTQTKTFTTGATTTYVIVSGSTKSNALDTLQLERGSTATTYAPYYNGGAATAEMLLKVGNYQDEQEIISGVVTRSVGVLVLDGITTGKMFSSAWNATYKRCNLTISDMLISVAATKDAICNFFPYSSSVNTSPTSLGFCTNNGYLLVSFIGMENITSANDANAWLAAQYNAGTPVIVVYPLATPTTESVAGQTLQVTDGDNVLEVTQASLTGLELEAQYNAAVSLTIQEVQDANLDNNVTVTIQ